MAMKIAHTEEEIERAGAGKDEPKLWRSSVSGVISSSSLRSGGVLRSGVVRNNACLALLQPRAHLATHLDTQQALLTVGRGGRQNGASHE